MFIGSVQSDININIFLLIIVLIFSIFIWRKKKNLLLGFFLFSTVSNLILYTGTSSLLFDVYNLKWLVKFTLWYWPWINLGLFVLLVSNYIINKRKKV
jgi:hypothetical protein